MTAAQDSRALKPCPFCGGVPTTTGPWEIGTSDRFEACIECQHCGFHISSEAGELFDKDKALRMASEKWNRRAALTAEPVPVPQALDVPQGWALGQPITEEMHVAAVKVLRRATGLDGTPQRLLDAMLSAALQPTAQRAELKRKMEAGVITEVEYWTAVAEDEGASSARESERNPCFMSFGETGEPQ